MLSSRIYLSNKLFTLLTKTAAESVLSCYLNTFGQRAQPDVGIILGRLSQTERPYKPESGTTFKYGGY